MTLDDERWARIQAIFHDVVSAPADAREARLAAACGDDDDLKHTVRRMLEADATSNSVIDRAVERVAGDVLGPHDDGRWIDAQLGPYRVVRPLGEGGMGLVLLARRPDVDQLVAIKLLREVWVSPAGRGRFIREQRTLARLRHPSIAALHHADTLADGTPWFAMEYVDGVSLTDYCDARVDSLGGRLRLFRAVCEAVQYAHQQLVVHRDLKPSNILVTTGGAVKLLDFGIARQLDSSDGGAERTGAGLRLLTPNYAAPEQLTGAEAGVPGDVYSLGVILYELVSGERPFELRGLSPAEAEALVSGRQPPKPSVGAAGRHRAGRSRLKELDVLCLTAMHRDPARRYRSVEALIRDLDHLERMEPLEGRADSFRYRAACFARRHARGLAAAAVVTVALTSLVAFYTQRLAEARNTAVTHAARAERIQGFMRNLFDGGDPDAAPPNDLRVVTVIERGEQEARSLEGEPIIQAALYHTLGGLYRRLGRYDRADAVGQLALDQRRRLLGGHDPDTIDSQVLMALLRLDQGRLDEAEEVVRDAVGRSETLPKHHVVRARALGALGKVRAERGAYADAGPQLERAAGIYEAAGEQHAVELAATLSELANTHFYAGRMDESESLNLRVLAMNQRIRGERHPSVAGDLLNLGAIASNRERYAEATDHYRRALDIFRGWYGERHPQTASAMTILAQGLGYQNQFDESASLLERALEIQESFYGPLHRRVGFVLNELGLVALRSGRLDDAARAFERSLGVNRQLFAGSHFRVGVSLVNLGNVYLAKQSFEEAERLYGEALDVYRDALPPGHSRVAMARIQLGRALSAQRRHADAERHLTAGLEILLQESRPPASWVRTAREQLIEVYGELDRPQQAAAVRDALGAEER